MEATEGREDGVGKLEERRDREKAKTCIINSGMLQPIKYLQRHFSPTP
jgi:hypothetical protein